MHRGAIADQGCRIHSNSECQGQAKPKALLLAPLGCSTPPMGSLEQTTSCSFSPSSSISLEVVEKRDKGELFERMLVHNLRVPTVSGEVALSSAAWHRLCVPGTAPPGAVPELTLVSAALCKGTSQVL